MGHSYKSLSFRPFQSKKHSTWGIFDNFVKFLACMHENGYLLFSESLLLPPEGMQAEERDCKKTEKKEEKNEICLPNDTSFTPSTRPCVIVFK
jgi:hypothetical protein